MRLVICLWAVILLATSLSISASPLVTRQHSASTLFDPSLNSTSSNASNSSQFSSSITDTDTSTDLTVVKFAALLELLESTFYANALNVFTAEVFASAGFGDGQIILDQITVIQADESTHLKTLQSVATSLGGDIGDLMGCQFDFSDAMSGVQVFLATARVLEYVGIDAYIGGTTLISDKSLLVSAAEITTVEARHNTILNIFNGGSAVANPFDMVLSPQQVLSLVEPFISGGCDPVSSLGLTPTPQLIITNTGSVGPGTLLTFDGPTLTSSTSNTSALFCNMIIGGATQAIIFPLSQCVVPDGIDGPVHLFITNSSTPLSTNIVGQDTSSIIAGPALAFIDTVPDGLSSLLKGEDSSSNNSGSGSAGSNTPSSDGSSSSSNTSNPSGSGSAGYQNGSSNSNVKEVIVIDETTIIETRERINIKTPVDGGISGAIALGWL